MKKLFLGSIFQDGHSNNSMFSSDDSVHRFNPTYTPIILRQTLLALGIEINTSDLNVGHNVNFDLHIEGRPIDPIRVKDSYLIALENPYINRFNDDENYFRQFKHAFTWNPKFFHLDNITPIHIPNQMNWAPFLPFDQRNTFSCLINANKSFPVTLNSDLYQERIRVIRWYEKNAPDYFHLYGMGWQKPPRKPGVFGKLSRRINRIRTQLYGFKPFPSYRGEIRNKRDVLATCKFSFCYENVRDLPNYVTEKIIDSLLAGCVPIYWGANNVTELIPKSCFIDRRGFDSMESMHAYLLSIDNQRYSEFQEAIISFLKSQDAYAFSSENFASIISEKIMSDLLKK